MASQASARQFCRPAVAAGRSRDWSDSFVRRLRPIEAVGISGERTGEFSFTPDLDRHVWIRKSLPRITGLGGTKAPGAIMNRKLLL